MTKILEDRPPYVVFETRGEEDRNASIEAGHFVARDVDYAIITPMGSKDRIERQADEWLAKLKQDVVEGRFKQEWLNAYNSMYKDWKAGSETPLTGTAVENWPAASPAQVKTLRQFQVRTIEDLAVANEETLARLGMGGRGLKQKAIDWLASADSGKSAEALSALKVEVESLKERNTFLEKRVVELAALEEAAKTRKL